MTGAVSIGRQETTSRRRRNYSSRSAKTLQDRYVSAGPERATRTDEAARLLSPSSSPSSSSSSSFSISSPRFVSLNTVKREGRISLHKVPAQMKAAAACLLCRVGGKMFLFFIYTRTHTEDSDDQRTGNRPTCTGPSSSSIGLTMLCRRRRLEGTSLPGYAGSSTTYQQCTIYYGF